MPPEFSFTTTAELAVSNKIIDQVLGQEDAADVIRKASRQRRHVLLIGEPGTGKSMLGLALAQMLGRETLTDTLSFPNPNDENMPLIRTVKAGEGRKIVTQQKLQGGNLFGGMNLIMIIISIIVIIAPFYLFRYYQNEYNVTVAAIMFVAYFLGGLFILGLTAMMINLGRRMQQQRSSPPKLLVDNFGVKQAPFLDATGAHAGALLGDVLHDPFQSGGLGTPAHERVVAGMIHKAHLGVLFIDEIATLQSHTQQELLTALQEGKYPITGQSERSAGAMVRTENVPCRFVLVAAGNLDTVKHMHPALRSRIRGYGYEIHMRDTMEDTDENRNKIAQFVAQEVRKDKKIPHFSREAVEYIVQEARRRANRKGHLTLYLRDLGGLVRSAGDLAVERGAKLVEREHIIDAKRFARTLEEQLADKLIERKKEYEVITTTGKQIGRVNGLAVMGSGASFSGIILPIEAEVTPGGDQKEIIATGKLGEIALEAVKNVSAIVKRFFGTDIRHKHDIFVQFLQTYEGVEGDSASIAVATAIISALKQVPIKQEYAMTGSLSVRGEVLPIGGLSSKVDAAIDAGIKKVIVPKSNMRDIVIDPHRLKKVTIIPVERIEEVLKEVMDWKGKSAVLAKITKG